MRLCSPALVCGTILCCSSLAESQTVTVKLAGATDTASPPLAGDTLTGNPIVPAPPARGALLSAPVPPLERLPPPFVRAMFGAVAVSSIVSLKDGAIMHEVAKMRASSGRLDGASTFCSALGGGGPLSLGLAMWTGGAIMHQPFVQRLGVETTQAVVFSGALTLGIKGLIGRTRPYRAPDDPDQYYPGRGFFDARRASFPSGHTSAAFAMATVLSRELSARHPKQSRWMRGALYGGATAVGLARVYQNAHWPSDVVTGAALGTLSGLRVLAWHPGGR